MLEKWTVVLIRLCYYPSKTAKGRISWAVQAMRNRTPANPIEASPKLGAFLRSIRFSKRMNQVAISWTIKWPLQSIHALTSCPRTCSSSLPRWPTRISSSVCSCKSFLTLGRPMEPFLARCLSSLSSESPWSRTYLRTERGGRRTRPRTWCRWRLQSAVPRHFQPCEACSFRLDALSRWKKIRLSRLIWSCLRARFQRVSATLRLKIWTARPTSSRSRRRTRSTRICKRELIKRR